MATSVSLVPEFIAPAVVPATGATIDPTLSSLRLSPDEEQMVRRLARKLTDEQRNLELLDAYYDGVQRMSTLGISLPPELAGLRTAVSWPQIAVDPMHERLDVEGFRLPGREDADTELWEIHQRNDLDSELPLGFLDALLHGRSHIVVGTSDDADLPLVTVESAKNLAYVWSGRRRMVSSALQLHEDEVGNRQATLYLPDQTVEIASDGLRGWEVVDRDDHGLGWCPVFPMVNKARVHDRSGQSEITPVVRGLTDAACRAMLRMEVGAEFFSTPQRYVVGASIQDFEDEHGNVQAAWETYIGRYLLLSNADEDDKPLQVGQFTPADPGAHTRVLDYYAERMAEATGIPLTYLGKSTDNPASADAIRMSTDRLVQKAKRKHRSFEGAIEGAMRAALAFKRGEVPDEAQMLETIWRRPEIPTPGATTDAITKQTQVGHLSPGSDVALEKLGYTPLERARIARERKATEGASALAAITSRLTGGAATAAPSAETGALPAPSLDVPVGASDVPATR